MLRKIALFVAWMFLWSVGAGAATPPVSLAKQISEARSGWTDEATKLRSLLSKLKSLVASLENAESRLDGLRAQLKKLVQEKDEAMEEMRNGQFCSGCDKTRSQILAAGENFPHPGQHVIPPTPAQLKALEEGYDRRIDALKKQIPPLDSEVRAKRSQVQDLYFEFNNRRPIYHQHITQEQELRMREWRSEKWALEKQLDDLRTAVAAAEQAIKDSKKAEDLPPLQTNLRILQDQFGESLRRARSAQTRAEQQAQDFVQAALRNLEGTAEAAKPLPNTFGLPGGWFMSQVLLSPNPAVACSIAPLRRYDPVAGPESLRDRLDAPRADRPITPVPKKSMKDLLEGK